MDLSSYDLEYLRPPPEASFINHNLNYIKSGVGPTAQRRIFYNVSFEADELRAIQNLENLLKAQNIILPPEWNQSETLKFLYAKNFDLELAAEMIQTCLEWRNDPTTSVIDEAVLEYLEAGVIYLWGLDTEYRPILIVNLNKLKYVQMDEDTFKVALIIMFDILRTYCFLPRKIENWVVMVDTQGVKTINPENISSITYLVRCCFPCTMDKLILITSPNFKESHRILLNTVTDEKSLQSVHLVSTAELDELQIFINPDSLEKKYGGECPNVEKFWPPPIRNETYHRTSITSLKQYQDAETIATGYASSVNTKRGNQEQSPNQFTRPQEQNSNQFARPQEYSPNQSATRPPPSPSNTEPRSHHTEPKSNQSMTSDYNKYQPNQHGNFKELFANTRQTAFERGPRELFLKSPTNAGRRATTEEMVRNTAPAQGGVSPSRKYDPFQLVKFEEGEGDKSPNKKEFETERLFATDKEGLQSKIRNYSEGRTDERMFLTDREAPKRSQARHTSTGRMEVPPLNKQVSNQSNVSKQSKQSNRRGYGFEDVMHKKERYTSEAMIGEGGEKMTVAVYGGNKSELGFQRENMNDLGSNFQGSRYNQPAGFTTYEEDEENRPSRMSYTQQDKDQVKKRLVEIAAKKSQDSDEEDGGSKKGGLFCGCCIGQKKKRTIQRSMKKSKYENY